MKSLSQYIENIKNFNNPNNSNNSKTEHWLKCVQKMYNWYLDNFGNYYDTTHNSTIDNTTKPCELIGDKHVKADCSGFVAACLCLAGYINNPIDMNATLGSFNLYKNSNKKIITKEYNELAKSLEYMANCNDWECHKISDYNKANNDYSELRRGDILVKGSHVTIVADNDVQYLYDWGKDAVNNRDKTNKLSKFYVPKDRYDTYPYRSYWRLK